MNHRKNIRRKYFVDPQVQGALILQSFYSWLWTFCTFGVVILFCRVAPVWLSGAEDPSGRIWYHLGPFALASAVLFPIVMFTAIRFSHRFAGPMVRVRRSLKQLAAGESPPNLHFRDGDYWADIADDINKITAIYGSPAPSPCEDSDGQHEPVGVPPSADVVDAGAASVV